MAQTEEDSSSSDPDSEAAEDEREKLVVKTLSAYYNEFGGSSLESPKHLHLSLQSNNSCLICLSTVKRVQAVWSCKLCYTMFHLVCIQQWAKDGILVKNSTLSEEFFPSLPLMWTCPKCRGEYHRTDVPVVYLCFCGKQTNPTPDPWLLAHSCGEFCGKDLKSKCGHKCLSLCHPGPCPPCPKTNLLSCYCGQSPAMPKRCGFTGWSCGRVCKKVLSCNLHTCERQCHEGQCGECTEVVVEPCMCGKEVGKAPCSKKEWSCGQVCYKPFSCHHHSCQKECHSGSCGNCPRSGERTCPCGKQKFFLECTVEVPCCGDTCSKALNCGKHRCVRICHVGDCGPCLQVCEKTCRCGQKKKALPCSQEYLCERKCEKKRLCGRHQCRRKCCSGNCPPCEHVCGKPLQCKSHKCPAPCHSGRCYPCILTVSVSCTCGATSVSVPCGRERTTKPPRCTKPCQLPSTCHHSTPHRCHAGKCPPCKQVCSLPLPCGHLCGSRCHSQPTPLVSTKKLAPWERVKPTLIMKPCPPCQQRVSRICYGGHQKREMPCFQESGYSCGQLCGRELQCTNHTCKRICHRIINAPGQNLAGEDCFTCDSPCQKARHPECAHQCPLACHSGECPPCNSSLKFSCHCLSITLFIKCSQWCLADTPVKDSMRGCGGQCSKMLSCGHRCPQPCHPGPCTLVSECRRKVTVRCPCRRLKKEWRCNEQQDLSCTNECLVVLQKQQQVAAQEAAAASSMKENTERVARAALERQLQPRKRKRRRADVKEKPPTSSSPTMKIGLMFLVLAILFLGLGLILKIKLVF